jgi:ATP-dependent Clp protease protease subunit
MVPGEGEGGERITGLNSHAQPRLARRWFGSAATLSFPRTRWRPPVRPLSGALQIQGPRPLMTSPLHPQNRSTANPGNLFDPRSPLYGHPEIVGAISAQASYQRYREMTIDELLLENRVIFLVGEINYSSATGVIMRLLHLQNQKQGQDINLYINSPGGSVDDTLAIYDTMKFLACDVATYCIGRAASGGAIVLATGTAGKRFILPHARVMIHQPFGGVYGQTSDVAIQAEEILKSKRQINEILSRHTGKSMEQIETDSERDRYFSAQEAKAYGLVDEVLDRGGEAAKANEATKNAPPR